MWRASGLLIAPAGFVRKRSVSRCSSASRAATRPRSSGCHSSGSRARCVTPAFPYLERSVAFPVEARSERIDERRQLCGQRRVDTEIAAPRPGETQAMRVQKHALQAESSQLLVEGGV